MAQSAPRFFRFGRFRLEPEGSLYRDDAAVPLTPKAFQTLLFLVEHHGRIVEREELIRRVWPDTVVEEGNLSFHVHQIRKALGGGTEDFIATIPRRGYRFVAPVTESADVPHDVVRLQPAPAPAPVDVDDDVRAQTAFSVHGRSKLWLAGLVGLVIVVAISQYSSRAVPASEPSPLTAMPLTGAQGWEIHPAFSPDGQQLAYVWETTGRPPQIYVRAVGSGEARQLTSLSKSVIHYPRWSADGKQIAFVRSSGSLVEFFAIDAAGGDPHLVAQPVGAGPVHGLDWSPDGKQLAFSRSLRLDGPAAIFLLRLDTGQQVQVTNPERAKFGDRNPAFSPDGGALAFVRYLDFRGDVYRIPTEGGEPQRLTFDMTAVLGLSWTADGREIVFSSRRAAGMPSLWRIPATGGTPALVTSSSRHVRSPSVARRGNRLAFTALVGDHNIWRVPVDDTGGRAISTSRVIDWPTIDAAPDLSVDGTRVAFMSYRSGSTEIWSCDGGGEHCVQLTSFGGPHTGSPRWSPDGRWVALTSRPHGHDDIFLANLHRDATRRMTSEASEDTAPSWSRDGRWVYFGSDRTGQFEIWKASVDGEPAVQVTRNGGFAAFESSDGRFLFYTKAQQPGIWQMPLGGGLERLILRDDPPATCWGYWAVTAQGIYFVKEHGGSKWSIEFLDLTTRKTRSIASSLPAPPGAGGPGLAVSPDGRHIFISLMDRDGSNVMVIDNFL